MKKMYKILPRIVVLVCAVAMTAFQTDTAVDFAPKTDNAEHLLTTISTYDFSTATFDRVYNSEYSSDTYALGYGKYAEGANDRYSIVTCGGGYQPQLSAYAANGSDLSEAEWVSMYVDATGLANTADFAIGFRLYLASSEKASQSSASVAAPLHPQNGKTAYFCTEGGAWQTTTVAEGKIAVGDAFKGYVALPLSAFKHTEESGKKYISSCSTFADLVGEGYKYLCRTQIFCTVADTFESQTPILLDDLTFSSIGDVHTHAYVKGNSVAPDCENAGYTVHTCSDCGGSEKRDTVEATGHTYGAYKADADGIAYRICSACDHIETDETVTNAPRGNDEPVTVTFAYGAAGGEKKVKFRKGDVISASDIPQKMTYTDRFTYQFNCWTSDEANIYPLDPVGTTVTEDMTFYARWLIATYADKYIGAASVIAYNGGAYTWEEGKVIAYGNSNMSLYHALETNFAAAGLPAYNNSIAGSTSHEMIEYFKACVLTYRPKYIVTNVTTNDMAYYNMSEKQILANMQKLHEMVQEYLPDTVLFITAANPLPGRTEYTQTIERVNRAMQEYCETHDKCEYVDWYAKVHAYAEQYPTGWDTWTHLNQAGLKDIFGDVITAIKAYDEATRISLN